MKNDQALTDFFKDENNIDKLMVELINNGQEFLWANLIAFLDRRYIAVESGNDKVIKMINESIVRMFMNNEYNILCIIDKMIADNIKVILGCVKKIKLSKTQTYLNHDDLFQEGFLFLRKAILYYDPNRSKITTFIYNIVNKHLIKFLVSNEEIRHIKFTEINENWDKIKIQDERKDKIVDIFLLEKDRKKWDNIKPYLLEYCKECNEVEKVMINMHIENENVTIKEMSRKLKKNYRTVSKKFKKMVENLIKYINSNFNDFK